MSALIAHVNLDERRTRWLQGNGPEAVVKLVLGQRDVNPDGSCESSRTPLS